VTVAFAAGSVEFAAWSNVPALSVRASYAFSVDGTDTGLGPAAPNGYRWLP
jgi:hypothetical protein